MSSASAALARWMRRRGDTGCAIDTCATQPLPKNETSRLWVRSTNWSISTKVPGESSSLNEPQADSEIEIGDAGALEHVDIGAVVDVRWREPMALVVARQEHDRQARDLADPQRRRRLAPRALDPARARLLKTGQIVDPGTADDPEHGFGHRILRIARVTRRFRCKPSHVDCGAAGSAVTALPRPDHVEGLTGQLTLAIPDLEGPDAGHELPVMLENIAAIIDGADGCKQRVFAAGLGASRPADSAIPAQDIA